MKLYAQFTKQNPADFEEFDSSEWAALCASDAAPDPPTGGENLDDTRKYLHRLCIMGGGAGTPDHVSMRDVADGGLEVVNWSDDDNDYPEGHKFGVVETILPLAADSYLGGAYNTRQSQVIYAQDQTTHWNRRATTRQNTEIRAWADFPMPPAATTYHQRWVADALEDDHRAAATARGWREWTDGVPAHLVENGKLLPQRPFGLYRKPNGTRTAFCRDVGLSSSVHVATHETGIDTFFGTAGDLTVTMNGAGSVLGWLFTSVSSWPGSRTWPIGLYRVQLDCTVNDDIPNNSYGLLTVGSVTGHFARIDGGLTTDRETKAQIQSAFTGTGLKLATTGVVSWGINTTVADRFECLAGLDRAAGHGNVDVTFQADEADDFVDGPWFWHDRRPDNVLLRM